MSKSEFSWVLPKDNLLNSLNHDEEQLSDAILNRNVDWFIRLRWIVILSLLLAQLLSSFAGGLFNIMGVHLTGYWPSLIALVLVVENSIVILYSSWITAKYHDPASNLWFQIVFDLVCLVFVVHYLGSITTPAPFLFLLHIALSCVFFSKRASFIVTVFSVFLFNTCVLFEYTGISAPTSILVIFSDPHVVDNRFNVLLLSFAITALFFLIWYVVSKLSNIIRLHEKQLLASEAETKSAQKEKEQYIVFMTHQLKSPLDSIRSNINLIIGEYYGKVPSEIAPVLTEIDHKAKSMGELILDVLKLNTLKSEKSKVSPFIKANVKSILIKCIDDLRPIATQKNINFNMDIQSLSIQCLPLQIQMLFNNLLSNAINYSHPDGTINVLCKRDQYDGCPVVSISDEGIGIDSSKLPKIFDEFFRTKEAVRHNRASTGVGLAIVKHVAQSHGIKLTVESEQNKGTKFTLLFTGVDEAQ